MRRNRTLEKKRVRDAASAMLFAASLAAATYAPIQAAIPTSGVRQVAAQVQTLVEVNDGWTPSREAFWAARAEIELERRERSKEERRLADEFIFGIMRAAREELERKARPADNRLVAAGEPRSARRERWLARYRS